MRFSIYKARRKDLFLGISDQRYCRGLILDPTEVCNILEICPSKMMRVLLSINCSFISISVLCLNLIFNVRKRTNFIKRGEKRCMQKCKIAAF